MRLSVVSTMYRSAPYLREFIDRVTAAAGQEGPDYEIVLVNDGSPDESLQLALELQRVNSHIRIVDLSRNFGHHQAIWTGLQQARGEWVFLIDCDLEEDPAWLLRFREQQQKTEADVVFGVQETRRGGWVARWGGHLYYGLFNKLSDHPIPENLMTVRLMSRRYLDGLLQHQETTFAIAGLWMRTGFKQVAVQVEKQARKTTSYNLFRRIQVLVAAVTSFSNKPLIFIFYLGAALFTVSALVGLALVLERIFYGQFLSGWPSLMVSIWMLSGLIIFCQGVLGIYLARIFLEVKRRPITIVRHIYESPASRK